MPDIRSPLNLDVGLVGVTFQHEPDAPPSLRSLEAPHPQNTNFELQLEEVLYVPASQERRIVTALQPHLTFRDVLKPWNFNAMIGNALQWVEEKSKSEKTDSARAKFRKAKQTLQNFDSLAQTLRRFLHALHRG